MSHQEYAPVPVTSDALDGCPGAGRAHYLPLGINMAGLRCLVVGGGRVGSRKAVTLARAEANVTVLSPEISGRLWPLVQEGVIEWRRSVYGPSHLDGFSLVVAATPDPVLNVQIGQDAEERRILSCLVSPGRLSRVIFPATHTEGGITVAVHSDGRDCTRSRRVRDEIAALVKRHEPVQPQFAVFGLSRPDVPPDVFHRLSDLTEDLQSASFGDADAVVLSTCWRWECYLAAPSPRAAIQDLMQFVWDRGGVFLDSYRPALYTKTGASAFHHLLRVVSGLESPLPGETEIVGQVRRAVRQGSASQSPVLGQAFAWALRTQKSVRGEGGLSGAGNSWARAAVSLLESRLGPLAGRRVLLVGCGRLGESIASQLAAKRAAVLAFSRRAKTSGVSWCSRMGLTAHDRSEFPAFLAGADAVVVTSELSDAEREHLSEGAAPGRPVVVDLTGDPGERAGAAGRRLCLTDVLSLRLSGRQAEAVAETGKLALAHTLRFDRGASGLERGPHLIRIGARPSELSRAQVAEVRQFIEVLSPETVCRFIPIETPGDRDKETPLPDVRDDDFFSRDVDAALLQGAIDLAVHSAKDVPSRLPDGLCVAAVTPAFAPWECLVSRTGQSLAALPPRSRVGVSSDRRRQCLLELRPDVVPCDIRGNVPDRIRQLDEGGCDALILAAAGLVRLGLGGRISDVFPLREFPCAPAQGALALVVRQDDRGLLRFLAHVGVGERRALPWV